MENPFMSYAREDWDRIRPIVEELDELLPEVWIDSDDLLSGYRWERQIKAGIKKSSHFIFFVSEYSLNSEWCLKELRIALWYHKPVIPVVFNPRLKMPDAITNVQWIIFGENKDENIKKILVALTSNYYKAWKKAFIVENALLFIVTLFIFLL